MTYGASPSWLRALATVTVGLMLSWAQKTTAQNDRGAWSWAVIAGNMTRNRANDLLRPRQYDFADNYFTGMALAYERRVGASAWSWGAEIQVQRHFGDQDYIEFVLPATIRYRPQPAFFSALESFAFGLGLSHTTSTPQLEIDVRKEAARTLVYWLAEAAFLKGPSGQQIFLRVHHRSDAFGLLGPDSGSNAFALGFRLPF